MTKNRRIEDHVAENQSRALVPQSSQAKFNSSQRVRDLPEALPDINRGRIVDLDELGTHDFVGYLVQNYGKNLNRGVIVSWFRRTRLEAQSKYLDQLYELVNRVREHTTSLVAFKAELMTQQVRMENLMIALKEESRMAVERQRQEHETFLANHESQREASRLALEKLRHENEKLRYEAEEQRGKAELAKQKARIVQLRGDLIEKITADLNFADVNMKQVFVIIEMVKDAASQADIITAEARWEQMKAEARKKEAEAQKMGYEAEQKGYKTKKMKTELEGVGIKFDD
jgi:hypothetical protein